MKKKSNSPKSLEEALIDLYLNVKIRKQEEIENLNTNSMNEERENLKKTNPLTIIEYIKTSIDILIDLKVEERIESDKKISNNDEDGVNEYETLLRKLESDIRQHIKMEHQLKLHSESLQQRIEELEKENSELNKSKLNSSTNTSGNMKKSDIKDKKDTEISLMKSEIQNLKHILKSYEEQAVKLSEMEKKLRNQNTKHEKEMKMLEEKYKEKLKAFSKKLNNYEDVIKNNSFKTVRRDEDEDRVNYNDISQTQDTSSKILTTRKSPIHATTDRKRENESVKEKIHNYRKLIDKKINEISNSTLGKTMNKSNLVDVTNDRSASNHSFMTKDKSNITLNPSAVDSSKSYRKNDSLIKNLENVTKKMLAKENYKTHYRHSSMDIKLDTSKNLSKSPNSNNMTKNIHAMKEMLLNNKNSKMMIKNPKMSQRQTPPSNIILNQGGNPCFNQITIYTSNNTGNIKPNEINLRQYIFNKMNKPKSSSNIGSRSSSANNH